MQVLAMPIGTMGAHLGCKVHDGVHSLAAQDMADEVQALDVTLDKLQRTKRLEESPEVEE